ncbi:MAG: 16S rRNA (uracil(1498)-N(3))-methyltransferase [Patescibacteria group bacterium]|nr:16S rRNA (uracil(1498)-N(3))-methyltransferase [Patescibacteria group bacterium]MDE2438588.1 16S rRNA (uracil(1498)-N(3))-methyltransferase [Patescibacteria group bacterium]
MRIPRFIVAFDCSASRFIIPDHEVAHQIIRVLRRHEGDEVVLCDGAGNDTRAWIVGITRSEVTVEVLERMKNAREPIREVVLYCSILKREHFDCVAQKATEVGAREIIPLITSRTIKMELNAPRIEKIMKEAAEQSGRSFVPQFRASLRFEDAIAHALPNECNFFCDPHGEHPLVEQAVEKSKSLKRVGVFIGPEGGWHDEERARAQENRFAIVTLGSTILRAETAAIVASYLLAQ